MIMRHTVARDSFSQMGGWQYHGWNCPMLSWEKFGTGRIAFWSSLEQTNLIFGADKISFFKSLECAIWISVKQSNVSNRTSILWQKRINQQECCTAALLSKLPWCLTHLSSSLFGKCRARLINDFGTNAAAPSQISNTNEEKCDKGHHWACLYNPALSWWERCTYLLGSAWNSALDHYRVLLGNIKTSALPLSSAGFLRGTHVRCRDVESPLLTEAKSAWHCRINPKRYSPHS